MLSAKGCLTRDFAKGIIRKPNLLAASTGTAYSKARSCSQMPRGSSRELIGNSKGAEYVLKAFQKGRRHRKTVPKKVEGFSRGFLGMFQGPQGFPGGLQGHSGSVGGVQKASYCQALLGGLLGALPGGPPGGLPGGLPGASQGPPRRLSRGPPQNRDSGHWRVFKGV